MVPELLVLALLIGWALKGRYERLLDARIRRVWLVFVALGLMVLTRVLNYNHIIDFSSPFHGIVRVLELVLLSAFAVANIGIPGAKLVLAGLILNILAVAVNGGAMPVSQDCVVAVWGKRGAAEYLAQYPFVKGMFINAGTRLPWLCDIIPAGRPFVAINSVYSVGDLISTLGGMVAIVSIMRTPLASELKAAAEEQYRMLTKLRANLPIIAILMLATALRFWGLRWGLPNELHSYSYHPDEFLTVGAAGMILAGFFPRFYNYPSLYLYLTAFAILAASAYGAANDMGAAYLSARVVTALMGVAAVAAVYWAGSRLWGMGQGRPGRVEPNAQALALVAALILCIAPIHVQHSHFATVDIPSTLFVALCLGFAGLVMTRGSWRDYLLCGAMAGLAAGTKYNAGLVVLSLVAAHYLGRDRNAVMRRLLGALGAFLVAFMLSTPGSVLRTRDFLYGLTYEMRHAAEGHGLVFAGTGNGFVFTFTSSLWYGLGPALAILFVAAVMYGLVRMDRRALVMLAFVIPYYGLISLSQVRFARYALPMYPAAALLVAWMALDIWKRFSKAIKWLWAGLLGVALAGTLIYTIALDRVFLQQPPQDRAAKWIFANVPNGSKIGLVQIPWFYSPPLCKTLGYGSLRGREMAMLDCPYRLGPIVASPPSQTWWVVSDYEILDAMRVVCSHSGLPTTNMAESGRINDQVEMLRKRYVVRKRFSNSLSALGISFGSTQSLPHDMRYPAPTIWVYERKK